MCSICKGAGWLRTDVPFGHPQFGKPTMCECRSREISRRIANKTYIWLGAAGSEELESMTFTTFRPKANGESVQQACKRAIDYALRVKCDPVGQQNFLLIGPYGNGKTHLAAAIMNEARSNGVACLWITGNRLFQALYERNFDEDILKQAIDVPLLCFDDLDKIQAKKDDDSYQRATLFTLFNDRHLAKRPTIITSNSKDWGKYLDPALISRFKGRAEAVAVMGDDYRLIQAGMSRGACA